jgi:CheY-like chemotaxis protein/HPt (histidine-containing phosphotransfer) domain-containing protein
MVYPNATRLRFEVIDSGIGLSEEQRSKLFQPFVQADGSTTRKYGGTGLGLSICKQLIELMKGEIGVHSVLGTGSTFWFELPFGVSSEQEARKKDKPPRTKTSVEPLEISGSGRVIKRVLLVEDVPTNQMVATIELQRLGLDVVVAGNGEEAVSALANSKFAMVFMDCHMPVMDGYEATRTIRTNELTTGKHIPIVAMTANALEGDRDKCIDAGMDDHMTKPFHPDHLQSVVERWLNLPSAQEENNQAPPEEENDQSPSIDIDKLKSRFTEAQCRQLLSGFVSDFTPKLEQLETLIKQGDLSAVGKLAHGLKGAASMIFAEELSEAAKNLEAAAKNGDATAPFDELNNCVQIRFTKFRKAVELADNFI